MCKGDLSRIRYVRSTVERENICTIYARVSPRSRRGARRGNLVPRARTVRWIAGNSTAAREREASWKCDTNWSDVTYVQGTRFDERRGARGLTFSYLPDSVPTRASSWHWAHARAFFKFILANDCSSHLAFASFIAISCVRSIKIPRYAWIVTCVTTSIVLFSRRIVAIPSAYDSLVAWDWRPPTRAGRDPKDLGEALPAGYEC